MVFFLRLAADCCFVGCRLGAARFPVSPPALPAGTPMWKSFLLAAGIFACVLGVEMLLIDSAVVVSLGGGGATTFRAPDWVPWTLLSVGAATILQFYHLPRTSSQPTHSPRYH